MILENSVEVAPPEVILAAYYTVPVHTLDSPLLKRYLTYDRCLIRSAKSFRWFIKGFKLYLSIKTTPRKGLGRPAWVLGGFGLGPDYRSGF